jgi:hypothetical protein
LHPFESLAHIIGRHLQARDIVIDLVAALRRRNRPLRNLGGCGSPLSTALATLRKFSDSSLITPPIWEVGSTEVVVAFWIKAI